MIVVTGASRGLGRAVCERLLAKGMPVFGVSRKVDGLPFPAMACDVAVPDDVKALAQRLKKDGAKVAGLVNAAGIAAMNLAVTTPAQTAQNIVNTNLLGTIYCCQQIAPLMLRHKAGSIINFSTIAVALALKGESIYAASKAGVEAFTRAFAREMADFNVNVNCIAPGPIDTQLLKGVSAAQVAHIVAQQVMPRQFTPDAVADLVELLLDERSRSLSGQVLNVGGGLMALLQRLAHIWAGVERPFLISHGRELGFAQVMSERPVDLSQVHAGDVVALVGDFTPPSILALLQLIDLGAVVVPLTVDTRHEHGYFFESALVDVVIEDGQVRRRAHGQQHALIDTLRASGHAGLVLFSTGTTGRPKAILHDLTLFLARFETPRPTLRTLSFLLFDHIGGINTLLHTLFNRGVVVAPEGRTVDAVLETCRHHDVELLPTTPTFLRMMLMSGVVPDKVPACLQVVTYGTERMDQPTLDELCRLLPAVDFRQTFGMSELGIVRVKSERRDSLFMKVGGEGIETRVVDGVLQIRSTTRMLGYLNAPSPFDTQGWYDTKDVVEVKDGPLYKVVGRIGDVINVSGLKFMASEVERVALMYPQVSLVKAVARNNPITGQHVELTVQPASDGALDKDAMMAFLRERLQAHMVPKRIRLDSVAVGHRFKKA